MRGGLFSVNWLTSEGDFSGEGMVDSILASSEPGPFFFLGESREVFRLSSLEDY
jgi:hypothetical protein